MGDLYAELSAHFETQIYSIYSKNTPLLTPSSLSYNSLPTASLLPPGDFYPLPSTQWPQ